jgi:hypothetical protein
VPNNLPSRLTSLTLDGVDLQRSDLSLHCYIVSGLNDGLEVRGEDTVVPGARGQLARERVADVRRVVVRCDIQPVGVGEAARLAAAQALRDELEGLFDPEAEPATLEGVAWDGSTRSIEVRTEPGVVWDESRALAVEGATFLLTATEPDWATDAS